MTDDAVWTQVSLRVAPEAQELAADVLAELTGSGVTIEPPIEALGPDEGYVLDLQAPVRIVGYLRGAVDTAGRESLLRGLEEAGLREVMSGDAEWETIAEEDWAEAWKAHYDIEKVGRIIVRPAWLDYAAQPGDVVISLDPGMAFGTGQHPTTRMCLQALQEQAAAAGGLGRVLDLGSGSGILAIAAVALGAESVLATDTEEQAVSSTISNVALNGMQERIETRAGSIEAVGDDGPFDCILANINATAVSGLAQAMADQLRRPAGGSARGGWLAAGGVIEPREAGVREALEAAGLKIIETKDVGDWRTFVAYRV